MEVLIPILIILLIAVICCWIISVIPIPVGNPPSPFSQYIKVILYVIVAVIVIVELLKFMPGRL